MALTYRVKDKARLAERRSDRGLVDPKASIATALNDVLNLLGQKNTIRQ